jgi:hypothetical protein
VKASRFHELLQNPSAFSNQLFSFQKSVAIDENGGTSVSQLSTLNQQQSAKLTVRHKSGSVLFQP